jgi:hypothetical protein
MTEFPLGLLLLVGALLPKTKFYPGRLVTKQVLPPTEPSWIPRLFLGGVGRYPANPPPLRNCASRMGQCFVNSITRTAWMPWRNLPGQVDENTYLGLPAKTHDKFRGAEVCLLTRGQKACCESWPD